MTVEESLENLIAASPLVVEGKVRAQQGFWDADNKNIYTVNEIEIFKVFQGIPLVSTIQVVTRGGVVGLEMDRVSNALELEVGEMGLFMLQASPGNLPLNENLYRPTEGALGFIRYDLIIGAVQGIYENYSDITTELYEKVANITGLSIVDLGLWDGRDAGLSGEPSVERAIVAEHESNSNTNFEVHAGVGDLLTITGTDFGAEQGSVLFPDANSGGSGYISALSHQIKEWSDGRIILEVPYRAGTGKVRIDKANGESLIGSGDLPIGYDHINVQYTDHNGRNAYETQLTSDNGKGGYDFRFESGFAQNEGASQAFISLIETWACTTGVNFQIGEVTNVDEDANDGINIVRFDNGDELGGRTLAYARSRYRGCYQGETIKWFVNEIEVVVNDDYEWYYGDGEPGPSQFDFETVMLHEIGHTQQLGHVINANEVMHFAVGAGQQKRSLSHIDTIGGLFVTDKSTSETVCGRDLMQPYSECCETMAVVNPPSDTNLCSKENAATFNFEVDFADTWQWQINNGEVWIDLDDNATYSGTDTPELTVTRAADKLMEFRCTASNACEESIISATARLSVHEMDLSLTTVPATCDRKGQINLDRNTVDGIFRVSTNGGASFDTMWQAEEKKVSISVPTGSYEVIVEDIDTGCSVDLGMVTIHDPVELELSAEVVAGTECSDDTGSVRVHYNNHPHYGSVLLSLDGGETFENFDDSTGSAIFKNLDTGTYEVFGMWEDESCQVTADAVRIELISFPEATLETVHADCEGLNGAFLISLEPHSDFESVEVSLDGGNTYRHTSDNAIQENRIDNLSVNTYNVWIRWSGSLCGRSLGAFAIEKKVSESVNCQDMEEEAPASPATDNMPDIFEGKEDPETTYPKDTVDVVLKLYPNPTNERIYVKSWGSEILKFQLFSIGGTLVQEVVPKKQNEDTFYMDVDQPQAGVYTLHIITEEGNVLRQVVIK